MRSVAHKREKQLDVPLLLSRLGIRARRRGREWWACCPLHEERTPSWSIRDEPGSDHHGCWRCFGCSSGGGPRSLVARVKGMEIIDDVVAWLEGCERDAPEWEAPVVEIAPRIPGRLAWPPEGAEVDVERWPEGAMRYWERRGLTPGAAKVHGVAATGASGRCPWSIVFPVVSFGALRTWVARSYVPTGRRHDQAMRSEGAQPDLALWGEPHLDPGRGPALVCEGIFDALSLAVCGLPNAVAVLGASAITPAKVAAIARCQSVVVCTDADEAGDRAALELERALGRRCRVERARPPAGCDWGDAPVGAIDEIVGGVVRRMRCD